MNNGELCMEPFRSSFVLYGGGWTAINRVIARPSDRAVSIGLDVACFTALKYETATFSPFVNYVKPGILLANILIRGSGISCT